MKSCKPRIFSAYAPSGLCRPIHVTGSKAQSCTLESQANQQLAERISCLEQEVTRHQEEAGRAQQEVERLLDILREMENEKNDKDKKIHDLER
ncbi:unnamed protein product [Boreogadus saida]